MGRLILPQFASTIEAPELVDVPRQQEDQWLVTVYNNDTNTYEEVMTVLMVATKCTAEEAYIEAWEIDHFGQCVVHRASEDVCNSVAEIIGTIGIRTEVSKGW